MAVAGLDSGRKGAGMAAAAALVVDTVGHGQQAGGTGASTPGGSLVSLSRGRLLAAVSQHGFLVSGSQTWPSHSGLPPNRAEAPEVPGPGQHGTPPADFHTSCEDTSDVCLHDRVSQERYPGETSCTMGR